MHEDDYTIEALPACPMQAIDVGILVLDSLGQATMILPRFMRELTELVCRHANYRVAQKQMQRDAAEEIERFVSGDL